MEGGGQLAMLYSPFVRDQWRDYRPGAGFVPIRLPLPDLEPEPQEQALAAG
jgi:hypothetical protein